MTAVVFEDGSVTLDWPTSEGAIEYVIYRNGNYVTTVADTSFNDLSPGDGEVGYEIEMIKESGSGHVVSALAPVLNVAIDESLAAGAATVSESGAPELGASNGAVDSISVDTFEKSAGGNTSRAGASHIPGQFGRQ